MNIVRYAIIRSADANRVERYLPANYRIIHMGDEIVIEGSDSAGWTLDAYVLPRLASGLMFGEEIDLSHPIMKTIPA